MTFWTLAAHVANQTIVAYVGTYNNVCSDVYDEPSALQIPRKINYLTWCSKSFDRNLSF
jgi:hypothetical protein